MMDGILIVDKPSGMTSHDVVDFIRRAFAIKKVGHAGTLDPMATGVLVILLGRFTKEFARLHADEKEYRATMVLGAVSDTGDRDGRIVPSGVRLEFSRATVDMVFRQFTGEITQIPPMYSAVKVRGKKMYELARKGIEVDRPPRTVIIKKLTIADFRIPRITFDVVCSKGTYIRQLCHDIGERLGCGAYIDALRRVRSGAFMIERAVSFGRLKSMKCSDFDAIVVRP